MYKKRFAKWGFQKNSKCSAPTTRPLKTTDDCRKVASRKASFSGELSSMPTSPKFSRGDNLTLIFLTSVRTWSMAFFESIQFHDGSLVSRPLSNQLVAGQLQLANIKEINFAFKLVIDLLARGHGEMAGRMARKAFLLVEDMLTLEGPALVWNLLEMMHYMVKLGHVQLFQILLAHLIALVDSRMPKPHPLPALLRGLWGLVASLTSSPFPPGSLPPPSPPSPPSSSSLLPSSSPRSDNIQVLSRALPSLLEQAWSLNAEILFAHFDPRLLRFYCGIVWESCSIGPPAAIVSATKHWFGQIEADQLLSATAMSNYPVEGLTTSTCIEENKRNILLMMSPLSSPPLQNYEVLRTSSITALREKWDAILGNGSRFNGDTSVLLRMLAGLGTAKFFDKSPVVVERSHGVNCATSTVPRLDAGNVACLVRALVDLDTDQCGGNPGPSVGAIERIRAIVVLREYAEGETYPQVVLDTWLLRDALIAAGEVGEAQEVERDAYRRMERYIRDIPPSSA
jgi:hypothetical protein